MAVAVAVVAMRCSDFSLRKNATKSERRIATIKVYKM